MSDAVKALKKGLKRKAAKYDNGTVVRFVILGNAVDYFFAAIFFADTKMWYLTGRGWGGKRVLSEDEFLTLLSKAACIEVATAFEVVR